MGMACCNASQKSRAPRWARVWHQRRWACMYDADPGGQSWLSRRAGSAGDDRRRRRGWARQTAVRRQGPCRSCWISATCCSACAGLSMSASTACIGRQAVAQAGAGVGVDPEFARSVCGEPATASHHRPAPASAGTRPAPPRPRGRKRSASAASPTKCSARAMRASVCTQGHGPSCWPGVRATAGLPAGVSRVPVAMPVGGEGRVPGTRRRWMSERTGQVLTKQRGASSWKGGSSSSTLASPLAIG